ncbi:MAG: heme-binding protein, partial [Pseudomonadota bacterium]|nr:heme-binding protein [Pseudomonadota bacterium]
MPTRSSTMRRAGLALAASLLVVFAAAAVAQSSAMKTLRVAFPVAETGFDPQAAGDIYSNYVNRAISDPLYRYDYLARPYRLVPNTASSMPEISDGGRTWTIHVRK